MDLHMGNNAKASSDSNPNSHVLECYMSTFCSYSICLLFSVKESSQSMLISRYCTGIVEQICLFKIGSSSETSSLLVFNCFCPFKIACQMRAHVPSFVRLCFPKNAFDCFLARIPNEIIKTRPIDMFLFWPLIS